MDRYLRFNKKCKLALLLLLSVAGMMKTMAENLPTGAINGLFSVSATQQVYFSQGNLQYQASTNTWRFAENQYNYIGSPNTNVSSTYSGWIDLFGWGTSGYHNSSDSYNTNYFPYSTSTSVVNSTYNRYGYGPSTNMTDPNLTNTSSGYDWGVHNSIINGGNTVDTWRVLTQSEWNYVLNTRVTTSGIRYAKARVNYVNGLILLPDNWSASTYSLSNTNSSGASFNSNSISGTQWTTLENAGAVFLPAAGNRNGTSIEFVDSYCLYWSASYENSLSAYNVYCGNDDLWISGSGRCYGLSVRLVSTVHTITNPLIGGINGVYSVSDNSQVYFSQGNLQYQASTNTWRFAENQYEYIGNGNANASESYTGWIDLFCWGTSGHNHGAVCYQPWSTSQPSNDYYAYGSYEYNLYDQTGQAEWGSNPISNGGNVINQWRTLTTEEWTYVIKMRTTSSGKRFAKAQVNGINGVILLPDNWSNNTYTLSNANNYGASFTSNIISLSAWVNSFESNGAVFLPASGVRNGTTVSVLNSSGYYWSSSCNDMNYAYGVIFHTSALVSNTSVCGRGGGYGVRLVRSIQSISYSVETGINPSEGGFVMGEGNYEQGSTCVLIAMPNEGYAFANWTKNGEEVSTEATYSFIVTEAATYVANFNPNSYAITASVNPTEGGIVSGAGTYDQGATAVLIATPNPGYTFVNWTKDGEVVSSNATYSFTVTEAGSYVAHFQLNSYQITASATPSAGGSVSGVGTYNHGSNCTLTATNNTGYTFVNWTRNGTVVSTNASYTFTVTEAGSYVAHFQLNSYQITASATPSAGGSVSGSGTYNHGSNCTLTATANDGYSFVNWIEDSEEVSTDATYSFTVTGDRTLVANFSEILPDNHWTSITGTQYNLTMSGVISIDGTAQTSTALEVGAFCGNECRGSARAQYFPPTNEYVVSLAVVSNQQSGETITFRLYDHDTQQEFPSECINSITFVANANFGEMGNWYSFAFNNAVAVTATVTPEGAGAVEGTGDYLLGTSCTLTATANTGYTFVNWTENDEVVSTDNPYTFTVSGGVEMMANFDAQETTALAEGWTWWSTSIELSDIDGLTMLEESLGHNGLMIKSANKFVQNYYPSTGYDYWFGQLTSDDFTNASSYMIQTSANCEVTMTGTYADPSNHPIQLYPGWTWIGYPCGTEQSAASAFANFTPTANDKVKSQYAFSTHYDNYGWFPEFTMTPGEGYLYQSLASGTRTLTFANGSKDNPQPANKEDHYWRNNIHAYADNMNIIAVVTIDGEEQQGEDLELGAFVDGECRGSAVLKHFQPTDRWYAMLTVAGTDGEQIEFGIIDKGKGQTSMTSDRSLVFQSNAVVGELDEPYTIGFGTLGCVENNLMGMMHISPNPIDRNTAFSVVIPETETVRSIYIVNMMGEMVAHETNLTRSLTLQDPGVYTIKVVCHSGNVFVGKLIVK